MKREKLTKMKVKLYKFGEMNILPDKDGNWIPKTEIECNLILKNEEEIIKMWNVNKEKLNKLGRRLIKVYENNLEIDITPNYKELENEKNI